MSGQHKGKDATIILIIPIVPGGQPFEFKRIQFPVKLSFVMKTPALVSFMFEHLELEIKWISKSLLFKTWLSTLFNRKSWEIYRISTMKSKKLVNPKFIGKVPFPLAVYLGHLKTHVYWYLTRRTINIFFLEVFHTFYNSKNRYLEF